jgi:hypothetical protein
MKFVLRSVILKWLIAELLWFRLGWFRICMLAVRLHVSRHVTNKRLFPFLLCLAIGREESTPNNKYLAFVGKCLTADSVKNTHGRYFSSSNIYIYTITIFIYLCILLEVVKTYVYISLSLFAISRADFLNFPWQCYLHARRLGRNSIFYINSLSVTLRCFPLWV